MPTAPPFAAILVAAGRSSRMGTDKLWVDLWGRPAWRWSCDALLATPGIQRLVIAVPPATEDRFRDALAPTDRGADRCILVAGAETRADSVMAGLVALADAGLGDETLVLVHDAARPAAGTDLIAAVVATAEATRGAVIPAVPVVDSLKRVRDRSVIASIDRGELAAAQTPQAARLGAMRAALEEALARGAAVTDDAAALAAAGISVRTVPGDPSNRKLTEPEDVVVMRALLAARASPPSTHHEPARPGPADQRRGIGFDAHRLVPGRRMRIGGVDFPGAPVGPEGHSDGDAALHAVIDALLGAAGLGDIGTLFPPDDPAWDGADSAELLEMAVRHLARHGWRPTGVDLAVVIAEPPIAPRRAEIAERLAGLLALPPDDVSVKGTTSDGLGFAGREGLAAWAVASVERIA